jgi:hypothetical protein
VIRLLLGVGLLFVITACGGKENTHFTYAKSADCFRGLGKTEKLESKGQTTAHIETKTKVFELLFLPSGAQAQAYTKQFNAPNGRLATKGNVIIFGHRNGSSVGPDVSADEMNQVKDCLA